MKQVLPGFPYLLETTLEELRSVENDIAKHAVASFNTNYDPAFGYNVRVEETSELKSLWDIFTSICSSMFSNIDQLVKENEAPAYWTYVQNNTRYNSIWHTHIKTASINGVYYPAVPDETGTLSILDSGANMHEIKIKQGQLLLFPGWLTHKPNPQKQSSSPRVSINIELLTYGRPVLNINNQKVLW